MRYSPPPLRTPSSGVPLGQEGREERPGEVGSVQIYGHEFEEAPRVGDGKGSLACCSPWDHKQSDMRDRLN